MVTLRLGKLTRAQRASLAWPLRLVTAAVGGSALLLTTACIDTSRGDTVLDEDRDFVDDEAHEGGSQAGIIFPADAGVIDVTDPAIGAIPDDGIDDTAALQAMLDANPSNNKVFYFPDGVYNISATLRPATSNGHAKRNIFQGQSERGTVLQVADATDFTGAVIDYGAGPAQFFRNSVRDLTIDVGSGNPSATGLKMNASNQGTVRNVTIRSGDGQGAIGLDMGHSAEVGPLLVKNITIDGFDIGIRTTFQTASQTFDGVTLLNQNQRAWINSKSQAVFARNVTVEGTTDIAIENSSEGRMLLVDSSVTNTAGNGAQALRNRKGFYARNVVTTGYNTSISRELTSFRGNVGLNVPLIEEYWANGAYKSRRGGPFTLFESPDTMLGLPVKETPDVPWSALDAWKGPHQFGGVPNDGIDDTAAIQAAIDSGAETIYLPNGTWNVVGDINITSNVTRLLGTEARVLGPNGATATLRVVEDGSPVVIERMELGKSIIISHEGPRPVVLANLLGGAYEAVGNNLGDVFMEDVAPGFARFRNQNAYVRQLNIEGEPAEAKVLNDGGTVWILGFKTEDPGVQVKTINGGRTELLGAKHVGGFGSEPRYITEDASFSVAVAPGPSTVEETRNGMTLGGAFGEADVYSAFDAATLWDLRQEIQIDNVNAAAVELFGTWESTQSFQGGWIGPDALFASPAADTFVRFTPEIPEAGPYKVFARWIRDQSGQDHAGHASNTALEVVHNNGATVVNVNQKDDGGKWNEIGTFDFSAGRQGSVSVTADGANGKVIADAIRLVRQ